ncbi:MAG TPA: hypothetical protein VFA34_06395 [Actinomycetota bacterium]|jgi:hypothetical protein|nr:hypothetical protein [Actinomycetota bacterium]
MRRLALALAVLAVAAACSSTSEQSSVRTQDKEAAASRIGDAANDSVQTEPGASSTQSRSRSTGSVSAPDSTGPRRRANADVPAPRGGPIKIGFHYSENIDAAYRAFGAEGEFVDFPVTINKLVDYVNAHGGLGGRKIVPFIYGTDPLNGTFPAQAEEACTYFAEDAKVSFVVSGAILPEDNMPACHAKRGLPLVWSYHYLLGRQAFDRYADYLYMPQMIGTYRFGFYADALASAGYFDRGAKIGLIRYDTAVHKEFADAVIKPGLSRHKQKLTAEAAITKPESASRAGDSASQISSAMLRFRNAGVDHVLFSPSGGAIPLLWGPTSESQGYYPRLAFTSLDIGNFVTDNLSDRQLNRAVYIGWMPAGDTYMQYTPKDDADLEHCKQATGVRDDTDMVRFCDGLFFLKAAFDRTPSFGVKGLRTAVERLGTAFGSPWSLTTRFAPGRHDGVSSYRLMRFYADCSCFKYVGSPHAVP